MPCLHQVGASSRCRERCRLADQSAITPIWDAVQGFISPRMSTGTKAVNTHFVLSEIGVAEAEERLYRLLLERGSITKGELEETLAVPAAQALRLLEALLNKGLATRSQEATPRYVPVAPDLAIEALILDRQAALERIRAAAALLCRAPARPHELAAKTQMIEIVSGHRAILQTFVLMQRSARQSLCFLLRDPFAFPASSLVDAVRREALARGVRYLKVLDKDVLEDPGAMEQASAQSLAGEQLRMAPSVPFNFVICDQRVAALFLNDARTDGPLMLLRPSAFLDGFNTLFDSFWESAINIEEVSSASAQITKSNATYGSEFESLIPLLAAGGNDKIIAHRLGISTRTLIRRVAALLVSLDARTRFQAGWLAALRLRSGGSLRESVESSEAPSDTSLN